jgi:uncharacterized protein
MGERTSHDPGTFSWADLGTTDVAAAKRFYGELLGWEAEDMPAGEGRTYTMFRLGGQDVAGGYEQDEQERAAGVPPHWSSYVSVEDVGAAAGAVPDAGGVVVAPPFDVLQSGRMAVVQDPAGAMLSLWEPREHIGARLVNVPGALTWNDLVAPDPSLARPFYERLFGWTFEEIPGAGGYATIRNRGRLNGGLSPVPGMPPVWVPYFATEDAAAALARVEELGGRGLMEPLEVPGGTAVTVADPQGAVFSLFSGEFDD